MSPVYSKNFKTAIKCRALLVLSEFFKQGNIKPSIEYVSFLFPLPLFSSSKKRSIVQQFFTLKGCID